MGSAVDVTVVGAGVFGLASAWACAKRGAKVRVIDRTGVAAGCSGGVVGMLSPHAPERWNETKEFQFQSLIYAEEFWREVEVVGGGQTGYDRVGRLQPIDSERALELANERTESAKEFWQGKAHWRVIRAETAGDWAPQTASGLLIEDTLSARLHPRQTCEALAAAIRAKGGVIEVGLAKELQGQVIWATGVAGLRELSDAKGKTIGNGVKGQAAVFGLDAGGAPITSAGDVLVVPHADGTVAVGSTSEREYSSPDATDEQLEELIARACEVFPMLAAAPVVERWANLRPRAKSRAPMIGAHPLFEGDFIANGGFKIGFGMAPGVAEAMADLVLDGVDQIPDRFRPEASL
ncbi:glycine/D-amino acid oxidase-like deaminating enzyme [Shimia isoporae]|uniref:Glycine/D-amino acid oxidase-like deaminating enzyme n=1 Tax=Shimia isoporae TaxID=647720 RepID=A0A4R1N428_9RHOB|nr:FAD-dependent oxidoreductase [Shimia isoporae]TCL01478.1 glycine/D-amino acid oxidase-like deaminating enzyme [Shimia isoporae]